MNISFETTTDTDGCFVRATALDVKGRWMRSRVGAVRVLLRSLADQSDEQLCITLGLRERRSNGG
jgi:hypothetical protein